ncbi:MAG: hypothetical protein LBL21_00275 [Rickettsiales bacterium]|jgi:hypothetical protein|nr:hypothetical protein [Rickettsiales bacterium]
MKGAMEHILENCSQRDLRRLMKSQQKKIKKQAIETGDSLMNYNLNEDYDILGHALESNRGARGTGRRTRAGTPSKTSAPRAPGGKVGSFFANRDPDDLADLIDHQSRAILRRSEPSNMNAGDIGKLSEMLLRDNVLFKILTARGGNIRPGK